VSTFLFSRVPGRTVAYEPPGGRGVPAAFDFDDWGGFTSRSAAVTAIGVAREAMIQMLHGMDRSVHVYTFGEQVGDLVISGVAFAGGCVEEGQAAGLDGVLDYYSRNSISVRPRPIGIRVGSVGLYGFLIRQRVHWHDPVHQTSQFSFDFKFNPELHDRGDE
jgi:hypothetical protein